MKLFAFDLATLSIDQLFLNLSDQPYFTFLDGYDPQHERSEWGYIGFDPVKIYNDSNISFDEIQDDIKQFAPEAISTPTPPFTGGLMGFISYEFGYELNGMPNPFHSKTAFPKFQFGLYDKIITINYKTNKMALFITCNNQDTANKTHLEIIEIISKPPEAVTVAPITLIPEQSRDQYTNTIAKVIEYIKNGDIFQANLAQSFSGMLSVPTNTMPAIYLRARTKNAAPYSAYITYNDTYILSSSPESFLSLRNNTLITKPIKGTAPEQQDEKILQNNPKDCAENIMIVDLMRNDFSKICVEDSVKVNDLCKIETFKGLHHLVSTVSGRLKDNKTIFDAIKACFPGGSITGAPKIRAMQIIAECEQKPREIFCGAIGYIAHNGDAEFNIAIRTLLVQNNKAILWAGGGITSLSNPQDEYDETILKSQKWREILQS